MPKRSLIAVDPFVHVHPIRVGERVNDEQSEQNERK